MSASGKRAKRASGPVVECEKTVVRLLREANIAAARGHEVHIDAAVQRALERFPSSVLGSGQTASGCVVLPLAGYQQMAGAQYMGLPCTEEQMHQHYTLLAKKIKQGQEWLEAGLATLDEQLSHHSRVPILWHWRHELARFCQPWLLMAVFGPCAIEMYRGHHTVYCLRETGEPEVHMATRELLQQHDLQPYVPPGSADPKWRAAHWQLSAARGAAFQSSVVLKGDTADSGTEAQMQNCRLQQACALLVSGDLVDSWKAHDPITAVWALQPAAMVERLRQLLEDWTHFDAWEAFMKRGAL